MKELLMDSTPVPHTTQVVLKKAVLKLPGHARNFVKR